MKVILASESGKIPPTINHRKLNSKAFFSKETKLYIPMEVSPWAGKYSSINTTSYCGVFANILLKVPDLENNQQRDNSDKIPRLVAVSGRTEQAVTTILDYVIIDYIISRHNTYIINQKNSKMPLNLTF